MEVEAIQMSHDRLATDQPAARHFLTRCTERQRNCEHGLKGGPQRCISCVIAEAEDMQDALVALLVEIDKVEDAPWLGQALGLSNAMTTAKMQIE